ncbi:MAG: hypothetical protein LBQ88_20960 [Treponema sp.]|jgi:hypothetical protein|nr:hypothetical protein [Treponema sp.]
MDGLFSNPFIFFALIVFIVLRLFNALHEKQKNRPTRSDVPPADAGIFENADYWNVDNPDVQKEAVAEKNNNEEKKIVLDEDYIPFPQGIRGFAAQNTAAKADPPTQVHSVLIDIEKGPQSNTLDIWGKNIQINSAAAAPYPRPSADIAGIARQDSALKKAVIWAEILGPPRGLKDF